MMISPLSEHPELAHVVRDDKKCHCDDELMIAVDIGPGGTKHFVCGCVSDDGDRLTVARVWSEESAFDEQYDAYREGVVA